MSFQLYLAARKVGLKPAGQETAGQKSAAIRLVLFALADACRGDSKTCCFSYHQLAAAADVARSTAERAVSWLQANGLIEVGKRSISGGRVVNTFTLKLPDVAAQVDVDHTEDRSAPDRGSVSMHTEDRSALYRGSVSLPMIDQEERTKDRPTTRARRAGGDRSPELDLTGREKEARSGGDAAAPVPARSKAARHDPDFAAFYAAYPRKDAPDAALRAWRSAMKEGATPAGIMAALAAYQFSANPKYRPYPATWLNSGCWRGGQTIVPDTIYKPTNLTWMQPGGALDPLWPEPEGLGGGQTIDGTAFEVKQ